jgi:hypothetical protein
MFYSLFESAEIRLFEMAEAQPSFERIKAIYKTFGVSKEENK